MADISYLRNEDMEDTDEPMEGADDEETSGEGPADGRGDEGGGLPYLLKLQQHASCNPSYNRELVGRILVEVFRGAVETGMELDVDEVMQPVLKFVNDADAAVRIDLVEQLPHVAMICQEAPDRLGDVLPRHLIQIIGTFLCDNDQQVRQSTHSALLALIDRGLLDKYSAEHVIAPTHIKMSQQRDRLELFTFAMDGMSKVARILDKATAERLFLNTFLALCEDTHFFIRKLCAIRFGEFSAAMSEQTVYTKLLPMYVNLCKDTVWSVRKSCADVIVSFACCVSLHHRRTTLSELLKNFLTDEIKWVKVSAFQILGPFISTFAKQFTSFSYSQCGELVLTDHHGVELRYNVLSFAGSAEPPICKAVITANSGQIDFNMDGIPKINQDEMSSHDTDKENVPLDDSTKSQWDSASSLNDNQENDATVIHDYDQFNPFRYYYIPPDLPLDTELVQAAIVESKSENSSRKTETDRKSDDKSIKATFFNQRKSDLYRNEEMLLQKCKINSPKDIEEISFEVHNLLNDQSKVDHSADSGQTSFAPSNVQTYIGDTSIESDSSTTDESNDSADIERTIVPKELVKCFVSMADPGATSIGAEIPRHCAFSFPAVALTLGRENWSMLKYAYKELACAREYKVRRTMASSIHELAIILGEELTAKDLLPMYKGFIKDLDEVRIGALKHLTAFLTVLRPDDRKSFLPKLEAFLEMDNEWNWRFREELANRLLEAMTLFTPNDVFTFIARLSFSLLNDKVAAVRRAALPLVSEMVYYLSSDEQLVTTLIQDLKYLLTSNTSKWTSRQIFAILCLSFINDEAIKPKIFGRELLPCLLSLSTDPVPNVRMAVAEVLSLRYIWECLEADEVHKVNKILIQMRTDPDRDVRIMAGGIGGKYYPQGGKWKGSTGTTKLSCSDTTT